MADYIYLLENRLSPAQKQAISMLREIVRGKGMTLFMVGGAVRDLTSGSPVRDLDVAVQGNALKLRKDLESAGAVVVGSNEAGQALYLHFPGGVRVEVSSTLSATYPKPSKPVLKSGTILEDLRRRDFTANAMALSLNEGSYGLLMDPLNGVADIENRELRLVSNYGFIEEPVRLIRAARFAARLGWTLEEKTQARYETAKQEGYISGLQSFHRGYEAEEIVHEEDPLRVMRRLEAEGWMQVLAPAWNSSKASVVELEKVRESQTQLQLQGIHPDAATVNFPLLTAKMAAKDVEALKKSFARPGFVAEIEALESGAKEFAAQLGIRSGASPSASYRLIHAAKPEAVLYVAYTTKSGALQAKFKSFFGEWPQVRQKIPLALMAEMRITPEIAGYEELVEKLFLELIDGNLGTIEEMRAFLEPYSPPAPPPPVNLRRARTARKDAKKGRLKKGAALVADDADDEDDDSDEAATDPDGEDDAEDEFERFEAAASFESDVEPVGVAPGVEGDADFEEDDAPEHVVEQPDRGNVKDEARPIKSKAAKPAAKDNHSLEEDEAVGEKAHVPSQVKKKASSQKKSAPTAGEQKSGGSAITTKVGASKLAPGAVVAVKAAVVKAGKGAPQKSAPIAVPAATVAPAKSIKAPSKRVR